MELQERITRLQVDHISARTDRPFSDVTGRLEKSTGVFDLSRVESHLQSGSVPAAVAAIEAMSGTSGFMRFAALDHGAILKMRGQTAQAVRYLLGHPMIAASMTGRQLAAGLYAPLSLLVAGGPNGGTLLEYDRPSSLVGALGDEEVTRVALDLDAKLAALVREIAG